MGSRKGSQARYKRRTARRPAPLATMLALLSSADRRRLLLQLGGGPMDVSTLAGRNRDSLPLTSHRLGNLLEAGLVNVSKEGTRRVYRLGDCIQIKHRTDTTLIRVTSREEAVTSIVLPAS